MHTILVSGGNGNLSNELKKCKHDDTLITVSKKEMDDLHTPLDRQSPRIYLVAHRRFFPAHSNYCVFFPLPLSIEN